MFIISMRERWKGTWKVKFMNKSLVIGVSALTLLSGLACSAIEPTATTAVTASVKSVVNFPSEPLPEPILETVEVVPQYDISINEAEAIALAKMAWGEARGCSDTEIAATMWCVLNRVDSSGYAMGGDVLHVVTFPYQFLGYRAHNPVDERIYDIAVDVLTRWQMEKQGAPAEEVGRVLPQEYMWFYGDGKANHFKDAYKDANIWDWSLPSPYETEGE